MNADSHPLWDKLRLFAFDRPDALLPFSQRLARDNRWSQTYAWRAMEEYRRFLFLAAVCEYSVTPSEPVDAVWHLHLCYTESYWTELCEKILGRPLHHRPTTGGSAEDSRHAEQYAQTLNSYENWFGSEPPRDLWPRPKKPTPAPQNLRLNQETGVALGVLALALLGAVFPPDWWRFPGPDFLTFYGWATVIGVILMLSLKRGKLLPLVAVVALGMVQFGAGLQREKPIGFLFCGLFLNATLLLWLTLGIRRRATANVLLATYHGGGCAAGGVVDAGASGCGSGGASCGGGGGCGGG